MLVLTGISSVTISGFYYTKIMTNYIPGLISFSLFLLLLAIGCCFRNNNNTNTTNVIIRYVPDDANDPDIRYVPDDANDPDKLPIAYAI